MNNLIHLLIEYLINYSNVITYIIALIPTAYVLKARLNKESIIKTTISCIDIFAIVLFLEKTTVSIIMRSELKLDMPEGLIFLVGGPFIALTVICIEAKDTPIGNIFCKILEKYYLNPLIGFPFTEQLNNLKNIDVENLANVQTLKVFYENASYIISSIKIECPKNDERLKDIEMLYKDCDDNLKLYQSNPDKKSDVTISISKFIGGTKALSASCYIENVKNRKRQKRK